MEPPAPIDPTDPPVPKLPPSPVAPPRPVEPSAPAVPPLVQGGMVAQDPMVVQSREAQAESAVRTSLWSGHKHVTFSQKPTACLNDAPASADSCPASTEQEASFSQ